MGFPENRDLPQDVGRTALIGCGTPVDVRIDVSRVADLVARLGEQLYGRDQTIPLRELIQNAADAVRARRLLEDRPQNWGQIRVRLGEDESGPWIEVEDTGIGMPEAVLSGSLLDFGNPAGQFGIGFFSVFMWGRRVRVVSRPCGDSQSATRVLELGTGAEGRPILRPARPEELHPEGGTRVRVWLVRKPEQMGGLLAQIPGEPLLDLGALCAWLAPALDVDLWAEDEKGARRVVEASDWLTLDGEELILRLGLGSEWAEHQAEAFAPLLRELRDSEGRLLGRAAVSDTNPAGVVTVGGLRATWPYPATGILLGETSRATRDRADLLATPSSLQVWASGQASLLLDAALNATLKVIAASAVISYGGDPGVLPFAKCGEEFVNLEAISRWGCGLDEALLYRFEDDWMLGHISLGPKVLGFYPIACMGGERVENAIGKALARAWDCDIQELEASRMREERKVSEGMPAQDVTVLVRPRRQRK